MPLAAHGTLTTLLQLLPTYGTSTLPATLTDLATSLYASSRARAPVLKREEEIAREYACSVLAIERLKAKLNLPEVERRPPCPPRAFAKLLNFLDEVLPSSVGSAAATPSKGTKNRATNQTPRKRASSIDKPLTPAQESSKRRKATATEYDNSLATNEITVQQDHVPSWLPAFLEDVRPLLQTSQGFAEAVTKGAAATCPKAASSAANGSTLSKKAQLAQQRVPAIIIALTLVVLERFGQQRNIRDTAKTAVKELIVRRVITMIQFGKVVAEAEALLEERAPGWRKMSWYTDAAAENNGAVEASDQDPVIDMPQAATLVQSAPNDATTSAADVGEGLVEADEEDEEDGQDTTARREMPRGGTSTMLQPRVDWLSPERRAHYVTWKEQIMQRIEAMEQGSGEAA